MFPYTFSPLKVGTVELKNRLVMAPMGSAYANTAGEVTEQLLAYYEARARGGVGLIVVEGAYPEEKGRVLIGQLAADRDELISGLSRLATRVHGAGARVVLQILHGGRQSRGAACGGQPVAPSAIPCPVVQEMPHELTPPEIISTVEAFANAALRAQKAGFDGVELHCAHGYLLNQFLSPYSNRRNDAYGGSTKARSKIVVETIRRVRTLTSNSFILGCRISAEEFVPGGLTLDESTKVAQILAASGIDYLSVSGGVYASLHRVIPPSDIPSRSLVYLARGIKERISLPVVCVGGIAEPEEIEDILRNHDADLVALGRALLADPDLPTKMQQGKKEEIIPCVRCNHCRRREIRPQINCLMNYRTGRESEVQITTAPVKKRVLVIGGGPGGMEAARVTALRGHNVTLWERQAKLGGQLLLASMPPGKDRLMQGIYYLERQLKKLKVEISLGQEADASSVAQLNPDVVILASGSSPVIPQVKGLQKMKYYTARQVMSDCTLELGRHVLVVGGGLVGAEVADYLRAMGKTVTIIEQLPDLVPDAEMGVRTLLLERLLGTSEKVLALTSTTLKEVIDSSTVLVEVKGKERLLVEIDSIVFAVGSEPDKSLLPQLQRLDTKVHVIGDAHQARTALEAIHEGFQVGIQV